MLLAANGEHIELHQDLSQMLQWFGGTLQPRVEVHWMFTSEHRPVARVELV